jgi:hypothetical protein
MARKVDVVKAFNKLPYEAQFSLETILGDDDLKLKDVEIQYLIDEVKFVISKLQMDLEDSWGDEELEQFHKDLKGCKKWLSYYKRYDGVKN